MNSCLQPLPEQLAFLTCYIEGRCGITLAALPGASAPHTLGIALDVEDEAGWKAAFLAHGFTWQGVRDRMHYRWAGAHRADVAELGVKATQHLLNLHGAHLLEDGVYGAQTQTALLAAPASGW